MSSESERRIMYVCSQCADNYPEGCGHFDRNDLRLMPDGRWLCEGCFDDTDQVDRGNKDEDQYVSWADMPVPPIMTQLTEKEWQNVLYALEFAAKQFGFSPQYNPVPWVHEFHETLLKIRKEHPRTQSEEETLQIKDV